MAELLLDINPNSSDPQQAKEDQIVKTALDGMFGGATPELTADALEKQQAVIAAMEAYGGPTPPRRSSRARRPRSARSANRRQPPRHQAANGCR
ncbi:hypothetical protein [Mesorhizobium ventifaucium]|uniref:Uncharacterized protein n=1 Tax=Mesorhizobium ventifaucium TaxID=666020 RepID=A0ABN8JEV7_9HYPH|nr:hypothetical protein [Mesorhizobium ventifaucium]CAH2395249.1 hypothetical protein MES4922_120047 [Mesorhizobium ventifaucium]